MSMWRKRKVNPQNNCQVFMPSSKTLCIYHCQRLHPSTRGMIVWVSPVVSMSLCNTASTQVSGTLPSPAFTVRETRFERRWKIKLSFSNTNNHREENGKKRNLLGKILSLKYRVWNIWKWSWCMVKLPLPLPFSDWAGIYSRCIWKVTLPPQTLYNYWLGYKDAFQWTAAQYLLWEFSQPPTALSSDDFLKVKWLIGLGQFRSI